MNNIQPFQNSCSDPSDTLISFLQRRSAESKQIIHNARAIKTFKQAKYQNPSKSEMQRSNPELQSFNLGSFKTNYTQKNIENGRIQDDSISSDNIFEDAKYKIKTNDLIDNVKVKSLNVSQESLLFPFSEENNDENYDNDLLLTFHNEGNEMIDKIVKV